MRPGPRCAVMRDVRWLAVLLLVVVAAWACWACGPTDVAPSVGAVCATLATPICARAGVCGGASDPKCPKDFTASCCTADVCGMQSTVTDLGQLDVCKKDIASWDCNMLGAGTLPPSCPSFQPAK